MQPYSSHSRYKETWRQRNEVPRPAEFLALQGRSLKLGLRAEVRTEPNKSHSAGEKGWPRLFLAGLCDRSRPPGQARFCGAHGERCALPGASARTPDDDRFIPDAPRGSPAKKNFSFSSHLFPAGRARGSPGPGCPCRLSSNPTPPVIARRETTAQSLKVASVRRRWPWWDRPLRKCHRRSSRGSPFSYAGWRS